MDDILEVLDIFSNFLKSKKFGKKPNNVGRGGLVHKMKKNLMNFLKIVKP